MWTETVASGKSRFSWLQSVHKNELLSSVQWWDIYSVKVIKLNIGYSNCRKLTVTKSLHNFNCNCNWKVLLTVTITVTEKNQ